MLSQIVAWSTCSPTGWLPMAMSLTVSVHSHLASSSPVATYSTWPPAAGMWNSVTSGYINDGSYLTRWHRHQRYWEVWWLPQLLVSHHQVHWASGRSLGKYFLCWWWLMRVLTVDSRNLLPVMNCCSSCRLWTEDKTLALAELVDAPCPVSWPCSSWGTSCCSTRYPISIRGSPIPVQSAGPAPAEEHPAAQQDALPPAEECPTADWPGAQPPATVQPGAPPPSEECPVAVQSAGPAPAEEHPTAHQDAHHQLKNVQSLSSQVPVSSWGTPCFLTRCPISSQGMSSCCPVIFYLNRDTSVL